MTARLVGVQFFSNLLPGRVIDAASSRALPSSSAVARRVQDQTASDGAAWTRRQTADIWESEPYYDDNPSSSAEAFSARPDLPAGIFRPSQIDAAGQYAFYARMLAAPYYPSLNVYA